ncbi:MAG: imidazolonepropionase [Phycisphaerales bacterium]|nr:imidazolonepropionase [Phycisphaerales bacterium]
MAILIRNARVLTMARGPRPRRGAALRELGIVEQGDVIIERERIVAVGQSLSMPPALRVIEADGRVLMPGFVDCHTHACWAGDRLGEWELRLKGATYQEILAAGGGIMSTVRAVREASQVQLAGALAARLEVMLRHGTTTAEVKSGYGLSTEDELKMLRAIREAGEEWEGTAVPTALLGHAIDPAQPGFVQQTIRRTLPAVHEEFPEVAVDAFCEQGAWSADDATLLLQHAGALGHPLRIHADQFTSQGMVARAIGMKAVSIDHLEASTPEDLARLAASSTFGVILPCCGLNLDGRYAKARQLVDAGGLLAMATNFNPGSAPTPSMPMAIALAVRFCGLSPAEAIAAGTINAATLLGLRDRGAVAPGQRADLILLRHTDERMLAYEIGGNPVDAVICGGRLVPPVEVFR